MKSVLIICILTIMGLASPLMVSAQDPAATGGGATSNAIKYTPIVGVPLPGGAGDVNQNDMTAEQFVTILYALSISIAALLAVVRIIYGGVQYMLTDVVTSKGQAKKDIYGAILGLIIVLAAVFILRTINPQLSTLSLFREGPQAAGGGSVVVAPPPAITPPPFDPSSLTPDASGAYDLSNLTGEQAGQVRDWLETQCPPGTEVLVVPGSQARCRNTGEVNQGEQFNTNERFNQFASQLPSGSESIYNQFVSPYEPDNVTLDEVNAIVAEEGGEDFLFVVDKLADFPPTDNAAITRQQQKILCENRANGLLTDSPDGRFSVCVTA